ncbi:2-phosphosulfolactate phosphatase [Rheinheimera maricola]|uniref:Probable 2-phosphosulfolactate phosphatase n=1 Tax=Rheinheimera maricola TaxID=2793282 RepID=A0ABS7X4V8_9GAMM|nr:2-phosphosulfolactate phosphatase [Rheinheimera maricola]MBZ9610214.1 2-phosphosulfolactate phosphatase [Rheinheimera maricola]
MKIKITSGHTTTVNSQSLVVVIDVLRAFTLTSFLAEQCHNSIYLCRTAAEAFELKQQLCHPVLLGEIKGLPIAGFDYGNSPAELCDRPVASNATPILRTSNGVEAVLNVLAAGEVLVASFRDADAVINYIKQHCQHKFTECVLVASDRNGSDEDLACAEYMQAVLSGKNTDIDSFINRVKHSANAKRFLDKAQIAFPGKDLELACTINHDAKPMVVRKENGHIMLENAL